VQRYKAELIQLLNDMQQWGGEYSFIEATGRCCSLLYEHLKADNEHHLQLLECEFRPANCFNIFIRNMNA
jgi:hypothetical protein